MKQRPWSFAIDVGGTFCDIVARDPTGAVLTHKLLSSGRTRGTIGSRPDAVSIGDAQRSADPDGFWNGYQCAFLNDGGRLLYQTRVRRFNAAEAVLVLDDNVPLDCSPGDAYELRSDEHAPVLAIRYLMRIGLHQPIPRCEVRLGTTMATNALLERRGARVAFVTTRGFADLLLIGDQTRPELFKINIQKTPPLYESVAELDERTDADGTVLQPLDEDDTAKRLAAFKDKGIQSLAVCLLNAYRNPAHEQRVARIAADLGFERVAVSHVLAPTRGLLNRAETCVVDAYLAPVFRKYLAEIESSLPGSTIRLMTGAGGLVGVANFSGNAGVLSGPAGGLVAAATVAEIASAGKVIAFDMGGTSTDVSRYGSGFEYQYETRKAGVRIVTPVLAIETVASGGGSVCRFDGVRLLVGPESAGTDPGPACYGRGGPLTITDVNLYLGRFPAERLPFPLDAASVHRRLEELAGRIWHDTGHRMELDDIAQGFVDIANANMAAAVKRITIERGLDARDHTLVAFGGAGAQHACAVARSLGIRRIFIHPYAGILSALGIACAERKQQSERAVHQTSTAAIELQLRSCFREMQDELAGRFAEEGVSTDCIEYSGFLDIRYLGEGSALTVEAENAIEQFEREHRRAFGYLLPGRDIEVVAARLHAVAETEKPVITPAARKRPRDEPPAPDRARAYFDGQWVDTAILPGDTLEPGQSFEGPAIVAESTSTTVVDPGWNAEVGANGEIVLTDRVAARQPIADSTDADPIRIELFNNYFVAIAEQMGAALRRTAVSTNIKERLDFSCAVFSETGDLIANAPHIPVHLGSMGACVKAVREDVAEMKPGDVIVTNNPYRGGTHLPDVTVVTPVFIEQDLRFFVASRAHHAEIGGICPGSIPPDARNLAEEGVLIRPFKLIDAGQDRFEVLRTVLSAGLYPSRAPEENIADIVAQIGANQAGADAIRGLVSAQRSEIVSAYTRHVRDAAERKMRRAIAKLPDGRHEFIDCLDDGSAIRVSVTVRGDEATVDFTGTAGPHAGSLNAPRPIAVSAVLYCFRCLIDDDIPLNAGVLVPVNLIIPESLLNPPADDDPLRCPAVGGGNVETSQRIVDCIFGALGVAAASQGTMNNLSFGNDRVAYYETICGGSGAGPNFDGADAVHTHMTNTRFTDPEVLEARYPVRLRRFCIRKNSGGTGRYRGGDGAVREIEFLEPMELCLMTQRRTRAPYGLEGGEAGQPGANLLIRAAAHSQAHTGSIPDLRSNAPSPNESEPLPPIVRTEVRPGDHLIIETPGGGGFGAKP